MIQELFKIRNELYDAIPVKNVETWELLKIIKNHLAKLDTLMEANKISSNLPVMPSLPLDVIDFIGRCNLYRENGKWYSEDGLFANSDVSLLQYIVELNQKMDALGNET